MTQYIDKATLVAEIERRNVICKKVALDLRTQENKDYYQGKAEAYKEVLDILDTLEVKEVDLEKELIEWHKEHFKKDGTFIGMSGFYLTNNSQMDIAKHFFELGLKAQKGGMIEALHTEYEKGRADVIADTLSWLENCWPKYCSNPNIIDAYKEGVVKD